MSELVGMIGLGNMGQRLVPRLLAAGYGVVGWNRSVEKGAALVEAGMVWAERPRAVAEQCEVIWSCVADTAAVRAIANGPDGVLAGLAEGKVFVEMSTIDPTYSQSLAKEVAASGAHMLDCPISGTIGMMEAGEATAMVGGDKTVFERVLPLLNCIGRKVTYIGESGQAMALKLVINHSVAVQIQAYAEGMALAERAGIDLETAVDVYLNSAVVSPLLQTRGRFILDMPDDVWFNIDMMQKDVQLVLGLGRETATPLPLAGATNELLTMARAHNLGQLDIANLYRAMRNMADGS